MYSVVTLPSKQPVVTALPSLFSPHIASVQSVVKTHPGFPFIACGNTSGRVVVLMNNRGSFVCSMKFPGIFLNRVVCPFFIMPCIPSSDFKVGVRCIGSGAYSTVFSGLIPLHLVKG